MFLRMAIPTSKSTHFLCWVYDEDGMFWFREEDLSKLLRYLPERVSLIPETWCKRLVSDMIPWMKNSLIVNEWAFYYLINQSSPGIPLQVWLKCMMSDGNSPMPIPGQKVSIHEHLEGFVELAKNLGMQYPEPDPPRASKVLLMLRERRPKHLKFAYRVLRCEKKNLWNALKWFDVDEYEPILYRENFCVDRYLFKRVKIAMLCAGIPYGATSNFIESNDERVEKFMTGYMDTVIVPKKLDILMGCMKEKFPEEYYRWVDGSLKSHNYNLRSNAHVAVTAHY